MSTKSHATAVSNDREFVISRVFDAPREMLWKAWTDPEHMRRWQGIWSQWKAERLRLRIGT